MDANVDGKIGITAAALQLLRLPPTKWIVPMLLPAGLTVLAGMPKAGKSWLTLDLALSIATGSPFLGQMPRPDRIVYFALEDSLSRVQTRTNLILGGKPAPAALRLIFSLECDRLIADLRHVISEFKPCLIVVDTIGRLGMATGNSYGRVYDELSALKRLADDSHIGIVAVTHTRKQPASDPFSQILGSTALAGVVDTMWVMMRMRSPSENTHLYITGRDVEEQDLLLRFESHRWELDSCCRNEASPLFQFLYSLGSFDGLSSSLCCDYLVYCTAHGIQNNLSPENTTVSFGRQLREMIPLLQAQGRVLKIQHTKTGNRVTISGPSDHTGIVNTQT